MNQMEADQDFMKWLFNREEKIQLFESIMEHMKQVYMADEKDWIVTESFGKDSSLVLILGWKMLERLSPEQRTKTVHVMSADTKVETPLIKKYVQRNLEQVKKRGSALGIKALLVEPSIKNSFFYNVIAKGLGAPQGQSRFNWCQHKMKINPVNEALETVLAQQPFRLSNEGYDVTLLIGTRLDESARRASNIRKYEVDDYFSKHNTFSSIHVYTPIKFISTSDLWNYLSK